VICLGITKLNGGNRKSEMAKAEKTTVRPSPKNNSACPVREYWESTVIRKALKRGRIVMFTTPVATTKWSQRWHCELKLLEYELKPVRYELKTEGFKLEERAHMFRQETFCSII
jgi:hypothetical protein